LRTKLVMSFPRKIKNLENFEGRGKLLVGGAARRVGRGTPRNREKEWICENGNWKRPLKKERKKSQNFYNQTGDPA